MGTYASVLKTKLFQSNLQEEEENLYDTPPDHRKRRAIILNTDEGEKPTAKVPVDRNTSAEKPTKEKEKQSTEFKNKINREMEDFKQKMQDDFRESRKVVLDQFSEMTKTIRLEFQEDVKQLIAASQLQIMTYIQQMFQSQKAEQQPNQGVINTYSGSQSIAPMTQQNTFSYNMENQSTKGSASPIMGRGAQNQ
jgi:DNA anti-recombination protein RmuC